MLGESPKSTFFLCLKIVDDDISESYFQSAITLTFPFFLTWCQDALEARIPKFEELVSTQAYKDQNLVVEVHFCLKLPQILFRWLGENLKKIKDPLNHQNQECLDPCECCLLIPTILKEMGTPDHLTCLLRNLYAGQEATVRTGHGKTDWFQIGKGVCQGCILSPAYLTYV